MNINDCIELENGKNYLLLLESMLDKNKYFLAVGITNDIPNGEYIVLQEVIDDNDTFVIPINDPVILGNLIKEFQEDYNEEYND